MHFYFVLRDILCTPKVIHNKCFNCFAVLNHSMFVAKKYLLVASRILLFFFKLILTEFPLMRLLLICFGNTHINRQLKVMFIFFSLLGFFKSAVFHPKRAHFSQSCIIICIQIEESRETDPFSIQTQSICPCSFQACYIAHNVQSIIQYLGIVFIPVKQTCHHSPKSQSDLLFLLSIFTHLLLDSIIH